MRINTLHKVIMSASLMTFISSAPSVASNADTNQWTDAEESEIWNDLPADEYEIAEELLPTHDPHHHAPNCPVVGIDFPEYIEQYNRLNASYTPLKAALDNFIEVYALNGTTINAAVNTAYDALVVEARTVANCEFTDIGHISDVDVPGDCDFNILLTLPDGWVVFDLRDGSANTATNFKAGSISANQNNIVAIMTAQQNFCGNQWETSFDPIEGEFQNYVAYRLGARFMNSGTAVLFRPNLLKR